MGNRQYLESFIAGETGAIDFFDRSFLSAPDRVEAVRLAASRTIAPEVLSAIEEQNSGDDEPVRTSLEKLRSGKAAAVVTGQQLGFLGGPLLTLYKAVSAAKLAGLLEEESGVPVVPIFWLQSEDHDFQEIQSACFFDESGKRVTINLDIKEGLGRSVGDLIIPEKAIPDGLAALLAGNREIADELSRCYSPGVPLSKAYRSLLSGILARLGVLLFDFYEIQDRSVVRDLIMSSFEHSDQLGELLSKRSQLLTAAGYDIQVKVRKDSPLFFLTEGGIRSRVKANTNGGFDGRERKFELDDIGQLLDTTPRTITASALIRPLVQDTLLPTAAYVAGPSEFNYWVQIKPLYEFFKITQPLVVPRASFTVVEHRPKRLLEKLGISVDAVAGTDEEFVAARHAGSTLSADAVFSDPQQELQRMFSELEPKVAALNPVLSAAVKKTEQSSLRNLEKLRAKYESTLRSRDEAALGQIHRLREALYPGGIPQERVISFIYYIAKYGLDFIRTIYDTVEPLEPGVGREIYLDD